MTNKPSDSLIKVSVIIPTYNTPPNKLIKTIDSVLNQTESRFELIIIDDGSALPFSGIQNDYNDPRIIYLKSDENLGVAKTRNRGIQIAKAPYIAFLDAGDYWLPQKLEKQIRLIASNNKIGMVFCGARYAINGNNSYDIYPTRCNDWHIALLIGNPITGSSSAVLVDAAVCKKIGSFYTQKDIPEDWDLWLKITRDHPIDFVNEILTVVEVSENSRSSDPYKKEITYWSFIKLHAEEMKNKDVYYRAVSYYHARIAHICFLRGITFKGLKHMVISLFLWPGRSKVRRIYHYLYSVFTGSNYLERLAKAEHQTTK